MASGAGTGKGWLYKFLSRLLGTANTAQVANAEYFFKGRFNSDTVGKVLIVMEDFLPAPQSSIQA